ncbi:MAG: carbon storage regulator [Candidatus Latescibacteria bacterium 4484_7]|nr:MAG: carbon storage regulator [Candidatus Latescibacteria bacterium 4484_7]RKZ08518.1 MAG: carbon storage regulator [bacterium]
MLVLTRKINEKIVISTDIVVTVLSIDRDQVKIGIEAPRDISVHRKEVFEEIIKSNREALLDIKKKDNIISQIVKSKSLHRD